MPHCFVGGGGGGGGGLDNGRRNGRSRLTFLFRDSLSLSLSLFWFPASPLPLFVLSLCPFSWSPTENSFSFFLFTYLRHLPRAVRVVSAPGRERVARNDRENGEQHCPCFRLRHRTNKKATDGVSFAPLFSPHLHTHLAAKTFPEAFTRQIPTLRRYSCTWRTATRSLATVEKGGGGEEALRE